MLNRRAFFQRTTGLVAAAVIAPALARSDGETPSCNGIWMYSDNAIVQGEVTETAMEDDLLPPDVAAHFRRFGAFDERTRSWRIGQNSRLVFAKRDSK